MKFLPVFIRTRIKNKVFASFMIVLLLLTTVFTVSHEVIKRLGEASENILQMNYNSIIYAVQLLMEADSIERNAMLYHSRSDSLAYKQKLHSQSAFAAWLQLSKDNITEKGEAEILEKIDTLFHQYIYALDFMQVGDAAPDLTLQQQISAYRIALKNECLRLLDINQKAMFSKSRRAQSIAKQGSATLVWVVILVLGLGIALSYGLSSRIVKPIYSLVTATQDVAKGDYSIHLKHDSEDELGILVQKFNEMTLKLREYNDLNLRAILEEQQKIEAIFSNINEGIVFIGPDYLIKDINHQALKALNLAKNDTMNHHFLEVLNNDKLFTVLKTCLEKKQTPQFDDNDNYFSVSKDGVQTYLQYFFSPVIAKNNELLGALFLLRDITDLKELDRLKSEFIMIISHELKTPITSINMSIDLLRESMSGNISPENMELLEVAKEDVVRLRLLVSDLLDLSKIEAGKIDLQFSPIDIVDMMHQIHQSFRAQLIEKGITLTISRINEKLPKVKADEDKLLWVFSNLISNAIKAISSEGNITLKAESSGDFVLISVSDNGIGIPFAYQKKIFDKFAQVPGHNNAQGTGLGLMICREIIRAHGGTIWVESEPGKGADFLFTLPVEQSAVPSFYFSAENKELS